MRRTTVVALAAAHAACGGSSGGHPWRDPAAIDDLRWGAACGARRVQPSELFNRPGEPDPVTHTEWQTFHGDPYDQIDVACGFSRTRSGKLVYVEVRAWWRESFGVSRADALPTIERVRAMVLAELAPAYRPAALLVSLGPARAPDRRLVGRYHVSGGYQGGDGGWSLLVRQWPTVGD